MDALGKAASMPTLARQVSPATGPAVPIVRVVNLVPLQEQRPLTPWEGVNFLLMFPRDPNLVAGRRPNSPGVAPPAAPQLPAAAPTAAGGVGVAGPEGVVSPGAVPAGTSTAPCRIKSGLAEP